MTAKKSSRKPAKRRQPAELFAALTQAPQASEAQVRRLLHELQVHSEEITVQNEQLINVQTELEQARDRYADLYDFAPIGYMQIDSQAMIADINLAGAELLARSRSFIIDLPLATMFVKEHLEALRGFLLASRQQHDGQTLHIEVRVRREPERILRLVSRPLGIGAGVSRLLIALLDVTEERRLEAERTAALQREQERSKELAAEVRVRQNAEERVKALLNRVVEVQEEERRRLALNLHDHLGQQLTALRLTLSMLKEGGLSARDAQQRFDMAEKIVSQLDRDVDFLAWELRPPALDDMGLDAALRNFVRHWSDLHSIAAEFHAPRSDVARLPPDIESHLYRIVQEALNNVSKHAEAKRVSVLIERRNDHLTLIVEDDGRGFDLDEVRSRANSTAVGVAGIQERAATMGGLVQYESAPRKGTTLFVRIPLRIEERDRAEKTLNLHQK
ncbi:MAG: ATP-binding protein [Vicinamibacterales bacterium]